MLSLLLFSKQSKAWLWARDQRQERSLGSNKEGGLLIHSLMHPVLRDVTRLPPGWLLGQVPAGGASCSRDADVPRATCLGAKPQSGLSGGRRSGPLVSPGLCPEFSVEAQS